MKKLFAALLLCASALMAQAQPQIPTVWFTNLIFGVAGDTTYNIKAQNNPSAFNHSINSLFVKGTNMATTAGVLGVRLPPNDYAVALAGIPQSFTIHVTNTTLTDLNATDLMTNVVHYDGVQTIEGAGGIIITPPTGSGGKWIVDASGVGGGSATNAFKSQTASARVTIVTNAGAFNYTFDVPANTFDPPGAAAAATNTLTIIHTNGTAQIKVALHYNITSGHTSNTVAAGVFDSIIAGGGNAGEGAGLTGGSNSIASNQAFIGGGAANTIQNSADASVIGGGEQNTILQGPDESIGAVIVGGRGNMISGNESFIGGGGNNIFSNGVDNSVIGGGANNVIQNSDPGFLISVSDTIGGGNRNSMVDVLFGIIAGGNRNSITVDGGGAYGNGITNGEPYSQKIGYQTNALDVSSNGNVSVIGNLSVLGGLTTNGGIVLYYTNGTPQLPLPNGSHCFQSNGQEWSRTNNTWVPINISGTSSGGSGTVTSVALSAPSEFTVSGSPLTVAGTLGFARTGDADFLHHAIFNLSSIGTDQWLEQTNPANHALVLATNTTYGHYLTFATNGALAIDGAPLVNGVGLQASQFMKTDGSTNAVSTLDGSILTNTAPHFTNFLNTTNIVLPSDDTPYIGLVTNTGPDIFISFAGPNVGPWSFWITTNNVHIPPQVHLVGYSSVAVTNELFDLQFYGGTNRAVGAQSEF